MNNPQISIVIPSYRAAKTLQNNLPYLFEVIRQLNWKAEVIVVDDGSEDEDATRIVAQQYDCVYLACPKNQGKGAAVRLGMKYAKGDFRIFTDVDIPFEAQAFERFLYYLDFKEFDIVVGDRNLPQSSYYTNVTLLRKFGSTIFTFIVGRFVASGYFDTQCGMKGFRASAAEDLFSVSRINGFAFDVELIYISLKRNFDIKRLPVKLRCQDGTSVRVIRHGLGMLLDLLRMKSYQISGKYEKSAPDR